MCKLSWKYYFYLFSIFFLLRTHGHAQFSGGNYSGSTFSVLKCVSNYSINTSVYLGGYFCGFSFDTFNCPPASIIGIIPFLGGINSGFIKKNLECPIITLANEIMIGGVHSGFSSKISECPTYTILPNFYSGGFFDGFSDELYSCPIDAIPIYFGGNLSGYSLIKKNCPIVISGETPYIGGSAGGFASILNKCPIIVEDPKVFFGGKYDGFDFTKYYSPGCPFSAPLPIELVYFKGVCEDGEITIGWLVSSQINNDYFTVERSLNAIDFVVVEEIKGAGTSSQKMSYSINDKVNNSDFVYYRLSQTDFNNITTYYDLIDVYCKFDDSIINIYPNPTNGVFKIVGAKDSEVLIYNSLSELISKQIIDSEIKMLTLENCSNGIYLVQIISDSKNIFRKIVLSK